MRRASATVYVGNLPWRTTEDDLSRLFQGCGPVVDARIIQDPCTGRSRGYGFVELPSVLHAQKAIARLHGAELRGRILTVRAANPKPPRR